MAGATSAYVTDEYADVMQGYFPRVRRVTIKDAGHWVHSEQPETFLEVLRRSYCRRWTIDFQSQTPPTFGQLIVT